MRPIVLLSLLVACQETGLRALDDVEQPVREDDPVPALQVEPRRIEFESTAAGASVESLFTVTNVGEGELELIDVSFVDVGGPFSLHAFDASPLGPGQSTTWAVFYEPEEPSTLDDQALVRITTNAPVDGEATVSLLGDTLLPRFEIDPPSHDFGVVEIGGRPAKDLVVRNVGDGPGTVTDARFTATSGELTWHNDDALDGGPIVLAPGEELSLKVRYAPIDDLVDEGTLAIVTNAPETPELSSNVMGVGEPEISGPFDVELMITVDDAWTGFIDGVAISGAGMSDWRATDTVPVVLMGGDHVIAIKGQDNHSVISGLLAAIKVDGTVHSVTGSSGWAMTSTDPGPGWEALTFDDSAWSAAVTCSDQTVWGTYWPADLLTTGAEWVWWTSNCRDLKEAWFRYEFTLE